MESYHPFPPPSRLSAPDVTATLRSLGFGYRADFIQKTAKMLVDAHGVLLSAKGQEGPEKWLESLRGMSTADAREELLKLMGVGRKVADCILLMSLDKAEVIPVDTHVLQIATKHYGFRGGASGTKQAMSPKLYEAISEKFHGVWGNHAGWAHSVLFTADLKAFSDYGLVPLSRKQDASIHRAVVGASSSNLARKRSVNLKQVQTQDVPKLGEGPRTGDDGPAEASSLAERVKKRRRVSLAPK